MSPMKKKKPKAIILDYDDTVCRFLDTLVMIHNREHGTCIGVQDLTSWDFKDVDFKDAKGNTVKGNELLETMKKYEPCGLYAMLAVSEETKFALELMDKLNYKIIILTARKKEFEGQTKLNIMMHHLPIEELVMDWDKAKKINELKRKYDVKMFVDDNFNTVKAVLEQCDIPHVCLISKGHNEKEEIPDGVTRVQDLLECVRYLR